MSDINQLVLLAEYNRLMNQRQFAAAAKLSVAELHEDKGAFFKSVIGTLNHILVGDIIWLKRFAAHPAHGSSLSFLRSLNKPASLDAMLHEELADLQAAREQLDAVLIDWTQQLTEQDLDACITYNNMAGAPFSKPLHSLIIHLFLHQTHHRGQVTTLLSQYGVDFGETDLIEIIGACSE